MPGAAEPAFPDGRIVNASSRHARIAALAALVATVGDLILLYVANASREELGLPRAGASWLWLGGALGVAAIPFCALGYWSASRVVDGASVRGARALFVSGAAGAVLGSIIHGLTAVEIAAHLDAGDPGSDPLASLAAGGPALPVLWALASLLVLVASVLFAWFVGRGSTAAPRCAAVANPALVTLVLAASGLPFLFLRSFLTPAAPNLAHLVFFAVCSRIARPRRS